MAMYRLACKDPKIEAACRKPACVYPDICQNLNTDHSALKALYREARELPGIKKVLIGSGLRYDLAVKDPGYIKELVTHHVEQYLIPYFIAAHPGTSDEDMLNLALWLKKNGFRADQVQAFYPLPMASATTMYYSEKNPLHQVTYKSEKVQTAKSPEQRKLHKAFLRWHDPKNWPLLRQAIAAMGRQELIGDGENQLIPHYKKGEEDLVYEAHRRKNKGGEHQKRVEQKKGSKGSNAPVNAQQVKPKQGGNNNAKQSPKKGTVLTRHTGLPPRRSK